MVTNTYGGVSFGGTGYWPQPRPNIDYSLQILWRTRSTLAQPCGPNPVYFYTLSIDCCCCQVSQPAFRQLTLCPQCHLRIQKAACYPRNRYIQALKTPLSIRSRLFCALVLTGLGRFIVGALMQLTSQLLAWKTNWATATTKSFPYFGKHR